MSERQHADTPVLPMSEHATRLEAVDLLAQRRMRLSYEDGHVCEVDLDIPTADGAWLRVPVDRSTFAQARIDLDGLAVCWPGDDLRLAAKTLRQLAEQQAQEPELLQFWQGLLDQTLSLEQIAAAWGFTHFGGTRNSAD
jgi:hypothetical protein